MKIAMIGSGNMGRAIGVRLSLAGHAVFFGSKTPVTDIASLAPTAQWGSLEEAIDFGEVLFYSIRDLPSKGVVDDLSRFDGKIVVDLNNGPVPEDYHYPAILESKAEALQRDLPKAKVVKAFNGLAMEVYNLPKTTLEENQVSVFVAADDTEAREHVATLATDIGFNAIELKSTYSARLLEAHADLLRQLMGEAKLGAMAHVSAHVLPTPEIPVVGVRQSSNYH